MVLTTVLFNSKNVPVEDILVLLFSFISFRVLVLAHMTMSRTSIPAKDENDEKYDL